jgi:hypothetical protein
MQPNDARRGVHDDQNRPRNPVKDVDHPETSKFGLRTALGNTDPNCRFSSVQCVRDAGRHAGKVCGYVDLLSLKIGRNAKNSSR